LPFRPLRGSKAALRPAREVPVAEAVLRPPDRLADAAVVAANAAAAGEAQQQQRLQDLRPGSRMESLI